MSTRKLPVFEWARRLTQWVRGPTPFPDSVPREAAEAVVAQSQKDILLIAERISQGEALTTVRADFQRAISRQILAQKALARGGWNELRPSDLQSASTQAATQFQYLEGFLSDIASGKLTNKQIAARAVSYADAGREVYENERTAVHAEAGYGLACRLLGALDHCSDCVEWAALGWIPIEDMEANYPIGASRCNVRCGCSIIYRRSAESPESPAAGRAIEAAKGKWADYQLVIAQREASKK